MILLNVKLDNIFCFNDFSFDLSYPKKIVNNPLGKETLDGFPNLKYKKVNILIGPNASGKTTLGKALMQIFYFLKNKDAKSIIGIVCDKTKDASFQLDYIINPAIFYRVTANIRHDEQSTSSIKVSIYKHVLKSRDSYKDCESQLEIICDNEHYLNALERFEFFGWNFVFPITDHDSKQLHYVSNVQNDTRKLLYLKILNNVLMTFDPYIKKVTEIKDASGNYIVELYDGRKTILENGAPISSIQLLSSGTKYAVSLARTIFSMKTHENGFYFVDEQFAYSNSDIECTTLSLMIVLLGDCEQLFFTTHNTEILKNNLPKHSFSFINKKITNGKTFISIHNASERLKKNTDIVKNFYDNDFFSVSPNLDLLYEIEGFSYEVKRK